jgi:hypothetical protein
MPAATRLAKAFGLAAAVLFAAFIAAKGIPTLRHDWTWPVDRDAIGSFFNEAVSGWLSTGFGTPNPHPTTYLIGPPIAVAMWIAGPLGALVLFAVAIGYACMRGVARIAAGCNAALPGALGIGLFALFNPWVYNEVVAGHLVMVLAYGGVLGLFAEMLRGREASSVRLALWIGLIETQLQFFIVAMCALATFAVVTRKWLPLLAGALFALPSVVGLIAERSMLLQIPYGVTWQANQSVAPTALLGLGGYFPGYADRLGIVASAAAWTVLALALAGGFAARRRRAVAAATVAAALLFVLVLGVHGPLAAPYEWTVRHVPESGVFRELYDLAGLFAALVALLAIVAAGRFQALGYAALAAGIALPATWLFRPPSDLWVSSAAYPHPPVRAAAFTRVALVPAFQPLQLRAGPGDGADPDAHAYPDAVSTLNQYFPTYPADMALARYEQRGNAEALRALGVSQIVDRPWLVSRTHGGIGFAASSLRARARVVESAPVRNLDGATPLMSECARAAVVALGDPTGTCDVFFGDAPGYAPVRPIVPPSDSIDPQTAWIDARLAFAKAPEVAQALGGALTQSHLSHAVEPGSWLLAYTRGRLNGAGGRPLMKSTGTFAWFHIPADVTSVECDGLCELVAAASSVPSNSFGSAAAPVRTLGFRRFAPWFYVVDAPAESARLLRLDETYDPAWIAIAPWRLLAHVRVGMSSNGWFVARPASRVIVLHATSLLQLIAEAAGVLCALYLLKALAREPTKRAR